MARGRQASFWAPASELLALVANVHRDPKKTKRFDAAALNPFSDRKSSEPTISVDRLAHEIIAVSEAKAGRAERKPPTARA